MASGDSEVGACTQVPVPGLSDVPATSLENLLQQITWGMPSKLEF